MESMRKLKARVVKGHLVMDEPTDLPEGTEVELVDVKALDEYEWVDSLDDVDDPAGLKSSLRKAEKQIARGETLPAHETLRRLAEDQE